MDALIIVDIDHGDGWSENEGDGWSENDRVSGTDRGKIVAAITDTLVRWRERGGAVIFIVMAWWTLPEKIVQVALNGLREECIGCDTSGNWRLAEFLAHRHEDPHEAIFIKNKRDAFTNPGLATFLRANGVTRLFLAGCSTSECVKATAEGAVRNGFSVSLLANCTYPAFAAKEEKESWVSDVLSSATSKRTPSAHEVEIV